uniref:Testis-specific Y-encoded protein 1-like n=1 Tax=Capra hircus TaxID=9925 RepID=A0A452G5R8_CAPHI
MSCPFASDQAWGHEERERQSEECGSILGPWTFLVVSPGPPVVTPGKEATIFMVEAGEDREAQVDRVVAGTGCVFQLLPEDIIENVEVVVDEEQQQGSSLELEEKTVEEQSQERPGGPSELPALDVLQALATPQVELSSECKKNLRAYVWFICKSHRRRKRDLAKKSAIIQRIPGFWGKVIMNHPQVSVMITDQDKDFLSYMIDLNVSVSPPWSCSKLTFSFRNHPKFLNTVIIKEYYLEITGKTYRGHRSTPVPRCTLDTRSLNFLNWLSGNNCPESNWIAELHIISEDKWDDLLKDYPKREDSSMTETHDNFRL